MDYVVGDLVYYNGIYVYEKTKNKRMGIVVDIHQDVHHIYSVYWMNDKIVSNHVANQLELVYNV